MTAVRDTRRTALRENAVAAVTKAAVATKWLVLGAGTAALALLGVIALILVAALCLVGVGVLLLAPVLSGVRWIADLERRRLAAIGTAVPSPYGRVPTEWREAWRFLRSDPGPRRDIAWMCIHATFGLVVGLLPLELLSNAVEELSLPLWWSSVPSGGATILGGFVTVDSGAGARWAIVTGLCWAILWFALPPLLLRAQVAPGIRLLVPHPDVDLSERVAELTATRAAALDAHAVELRRIERALHDGAQNRLVTVAVLTGAARQALARDPSTADPLLERAQQSVEAALSELRSVVRSILPPVLESDGLSGALSALAAQCPVETRVDARVMSRCPVAIEAIAYYTVAEALTNVTRHSGAQRAEVRVRQRGDELVIEVEDNGSGGAAVGHGSGLAGIRGRVEAHDGTLQVHSPAGGPTIVEVVIPCG
ncbi:sensor histidine kinase [Rhodococcus artemisiae]|uniref:histidine kinase n=1 Tax=Rhodococcus artemisiae TaxID=714159 RepID=A0ABU7LIS9_9NOCA|nr:sensor domain-containing protein [Rhodococcus artemisiae]MEE2061154.1 sensor domain-containing protein [Rhodococcus artemisiae]